MLDIKNLDINGEEIKNNLLKRGFDFPLDDIFAIQKDIKKLKHEISVINHERKNKRDALIGNKLKENLNKNKCELIILGMNLKDLMDYIPNLTAADVPEGKDEKDNKEIKVITPEITEDRKKELVIKRAEIDSEAGVMLAGTRFTVLRGNASKLQRKLINEALDFYANKDYEEVYVPNLVLPEIMHGTGQYPKFKDDLFMAGKHYLIPTGEVPMTNLYRNKIIPYNLLENTIKLMTHTPCFREEVGAAGKDNKGLMRQHQFEKVELVKICTPDNARDEFLKMVDDIEKFIKTIGIKYRLIELCTGDIGFSGHKAFDFELFFNEENTFREIASVTWCGDFQARRMNTTFNNNGKKSFAHTINGTGLAVGRILEAIAQN